MHGSGSGRKMLGVKIKEVHTLSINGKSIRIVISMIEEENSVIISEVISVINF